jgi:hypothetical protein
VIVYSRRMVCRVVRQLFHRDPQDRRGGPGSESQPPLLDNPPYCFIIVP